MKERLRQAGARSIEALDNAVPDALAAITADDASAWFRHCGYRSAYRAGLSHLERRAAAYPGSHSHISESHSTAPKPAL